MTIRQNYEIEHVADFQKVYIFQDSHRRPINLTGCEVRILATQIFLDIREPTLFG